MTKIINFRIPNHMLDGLEALASRLGISRTDCILNAIQLHAEVLNPQPKPKRIPLHAKR